MAEANQFAQRIENETKKWLSSVIIAHNYCPFAKREVENDRVRYHFIFDCEINSLLKNFVSECEWLDSHSETETTLIIFPEGLENFNEYLAVLGLAEDMLLAQGYEGIYQLASFHPHYCFQGAEDDDAANYTNRSPYPMFHIIREASIEKAIANHPDTDAIPERNIEYARSQGLEKMKHLLSACMSND